MDQKNLRIMFNGRFEFGTTEVEAKQQLKTVLKLSDQAIQKIFSKEQYPVTVKRVGSIEEAENFQKHFSKAGLCLEIESIAPKPPVKADLSLKPISQPSRSRPVEKEETLEDDTPETMDVILVNLRSIFTAPVLLLIIGTMCLFIYIPYPEGFIKRGFLLGLVLVFSGYKLLQGRPLSY